ncbi:S9 family peptidase [Kocuria salsicia]|uniref:S9 family peptidase n=1 Tax=Kocuria salsicia TaxID=664639 RepID=UPI0011A55BE5|nr:alpha/beta fold hydrolase [Kocuria salsicia]
MTSRYAHPEQLVTTPRIAGLAAHRNGPVVVLRQEPAPDGKRFVKHAWSVLRDGAPVQLTHDENGVQEVRPTGSGAVYFTSERPVPGEDAKRTRLWLLPGHGEARPVLDAPNGISNLQLGGGRVFFVSGLHPGARGAADEFARNREIHDRREETGVSAVLYDHAPIRYWDHDLPAAQDALWFLDPSGRVRRVELPTGRFLDYSVAPDGTWLLATIGTLLPRGVQRSQLWRVPVSGDDVADPDGVAPPGPQLLHDSAEAESWDCGEVSPDGTRVLLTRERLWRDGVNMALSLWVHDVATGAETEVVPADEHWAHEGRWIDDESFVCTADHKGRGIVLRVHCPRDGQPRVVVEAGGDGQDWTYSSVQPAGDDLVGLRASYAHPAELVRWPVGAGAVAEGKGVAASSNGLAEPETVGGLVPEDTVPGHLEEVTTTAADGTEIRAWLALPVDEHTGPHPLLVFVHGGPWGSSNQWSWRWNPWPFVARGYAVLLPDPAISTGYGQSMIERGQQQLGGAPFDDVMAPTEAATARADVDPARQALLGGSYGGYMANWVATHTEDRFRCIVTHASLWNLDSMGATTDNTVWREALEPAQAAVYSPHRFVERIRVPLLVIHGDKDYRVPIAQGLELWSDLQLRTTVAGHRFLYYPDEGHWILKPANARTWYETVLAFLAEHVLDEDWTRPELLG